MDFELNEEQLEFKQSIRHYLQSKGGLKISRYFSEDKEEVLDDLWRGMAELGYMGITVSETFGGLGLRSLALLPVMEEVGRSLIPGPYPETVSFAVPLIEKYGTPFQKEKYLPKIAAGNIRISLALLESNGEFSPENIQVRASENGDNYLLQGEKILVPHADFADMLIVPVKTKDLNSEDAISLFLVDCDKSLIEMETQQSLDETRKMLKVVFNKTKIPQSQILGSLDAGWEILKDGLLYLNAALCSSMVGGMEKVMDIAIEYAKSREQFGQPIGRFQSIKHTIADMKTALENARSLSYYASWAIENQDPNVAESIAMARSYINEAFIKCASDNIQIHGGMGFTWEFDCHLFLKRAKSLENFLGRPVDFREEVVSYLNS